MVFTSISIHTPIFLCPDVLLTVLFPVKGYPFLYQSFILLRTGTETNLNYNIFLIKSLCMFQKSFYFDALVDIDR